MSISSTSCPKCRGPMVKGFFAISESTVVPTHWVEGQPEKNFFGSIKIQGKEIFRVSTYRCGSCGFIEAYAQETT